MASRTSEDDKDDSPSKLALENAREIGELSSVTKSLASDVSSLAQDMRAGFKHVESNFDRISERINKPPNTNLYIGVVGIFMAGIPIVAALIYFVVTSSMAPISERLVKVEQTEQQAADHAWDNFELLVRDDQTLVDQNMKINDTDTAMRAEQNAKKFRKKKVPKP